MSRVIGIDLGTTNSCVAILASGETQVIANGEGARTTPSVVAFAESHEQLIGQVAKRQALTNPTRTVFAVKRLIGRKYDSGEVAEFSGVAPFTTIAAENGDAWVEVDGRKCSPQEISAMVLKRLKDTASDYLGECVTQAVITVPAHFNDAQRQATREAGEIAGLEVLRIINEPTAAALAYGISEQGDKRIVVFDLGGGTFDVSILAISDGVFEVKSTNGDSFLGGEDFDRVLVEHLAARFENDTGIDLRRDAMALQRLREAAERAKQELSTCLVTEVNLPFISANEAGPTHLELRLEREEVEAQFAALVERLAGPCETALADAGYRREEIDEVLLVGGMTRMPLVQRRVTQIFGREPHRGVDPDEVVAAGAAMQGGVLTGEVDDVLLLDVTALSLGVETQGGVMTALIAKNTTIPTTNTQVFSTTEDHQEVVRIHVLQGERELAVDNMTLGRFELVGIAPAPRGVPQIQVTFAIDADGVVHVSACDVGTGRSQSIVVEALSGLDRQEIDRLVAEAEEQAGEDHARRAWVDLVNKAKGLVYSAGRALDEFASDVDPADEVAIASAVEKVSAAIESGAPKLLEQEVDDLAGRIYGLTESLYASLREDGV
jgi:molecular chaperone DnaK